MSFPCPGLLAALYSTVRAVCNYAHQDPRPSLPFTCSLLWNSQAPHLDSKPPPALDSGLGPGICLGLSMGQELTSCRQDQEGADTLSSTLSPLLLPAEGPAQASPPVPTVAAGATELLANPSLEQVTNKPKLSFLQMCDKRSVSDRHALSQPYPLLRHHHSMPDPEVSSSRLTSAPSLDIGPGCSPLTSVQHSLETSFPSCTWVACSTNQCGHLVEPFINTLTPFHSSLFPLLLAWAACCAPCLGLAPDSMRAEL